ncbi:MAG: hypothetical protein U1F43_06160 [Myxococcota bacterium]
MELHVAEAVTRASAAAGVRLVADGRPCADASFPGDTSRSVEVRCPVASDRPRLELALTGALRTPAGALVSTFSGEAAWSDTVDLDALPETQPGCRAIAF